MIENMYTTGAYLEKNPTWIVEDSDPKAKQVMQMITRNNIVPKTICEVGCGAGEILKQLQENMDDQCMFWGYEISPQALELCKSRENAKLHFKLADIRQEKDVAFDLILFMDVIEHLEDYFSFLREMRPKSEYKIFHIPLELTLYTVVSGLLASRERHGHLHYFTKDLFLQVLKDTGYEVLDYFYTPYCLYSRESVKLKIRTRLLKLARELMFALDKDLTVRVLGGWSLEVLAK